MLKTIYDTVLHYTLQVTNDKFMTICSLTLMLYSCSGGISISKVQVHKVYLSFHNTILVYGYVILVWQVPLYYNSVFYNFILYIIMRFSTSSANYLSL